jgi:hypothetical protein
LVLHPGAAARAYNRGGHQGRHIDRAANVLPMRHSDLFFDLMLHIDLARTRLAARLAELRSERRVA